MKTWVYYRRRNLNRVFFSLYNNYSYNSYRKSLKELNSIPEFKFLEVVNP